MLVILTSLVSLLSVASATTPTNTKTYVKRRVYNGTGCVAGNVKYAENWDWWADGVCREESPGKYRKYTCNSTLAIKREYTSSDCSESSVTNNDKVTEATNTCTPTGANNADSKEFTCSNATESMSFLYLRINLDILIKIFI